MRVLIILLLFATVAHADESLTMLEELLNSSEQVRIEAFLVKQKVKRPAMYARIICQELQNPAERKLFAVKLVKESGGVTTATSSVGAIGSWQVMPFWVRRFKVKNPRDPLTNLRLAKRVYRIHLAEAKGKVWGHRGAIWRYAGGSDRYVAETARLIRTV